MPAAHRSLLSDVTFWLEAGRASEPAKVDERVAAFYVPLANGDAHAWGILPAKAGGIVIVEQSLLLEPEASWIHDAYPGYLLHEVAHAMEDRLLGRHHGRAQTAFRLAKERKLYDSVSCRIRADGGKITTATAPAYANTNEMEYFAEISTAYLGLPTGYYPFSRDELRLHDRDGYELMDEFWKSVPSSAVNAFSFPITVDRVAQTGRRFRLCDLMPGKDKAFDAWPGMSLIATDMLDGKEYQFKSATDGKWRLGPKQPEVTSPPVEPSRTPARPPAPTIRGTPSA
jgi:hypothetical protein